MPSLRMKPAPGWPENDNRPARKSAFDRLSVDATKPATSTVAPGPNAMPMGLIRGMKTNHQMRKRLTPDERLEGIPLEQASPSERKLAHSKNERHYFDCSAEVRTHFASMANVEVVKGRVPDILSSLAIDQVAYLHGNTSLL